jgi:hypothetical protein
MHRAERSAMASSGVNVLMSWTVPPRLSSTLRDGGASSARLY